MNYLVDVIPNDLKYVLLENCDYISKVILYLFYIKHDPFINIHQASLHIYRRFYNHEIYKLVEYNDIELLEDLIQINIKEYYITDLLRLETNLDAILKGICVNGSLDLFNWYLTKFSYIHPKLQIEACYLALSHNNLNLFSNLLSKNFECGSNIFLACVKSNNLELFKNMLFTIFNIQESIRYNLKDLKDPFFINSLYIKKHLPKIYKAIALNNNYELFEYIYDAYPISDTSPLAYFLIKNGEYLEWSTKRWIPLSKNYCNIAAKQGNLNLLKKLRDIGCPWDEKVIYKACQGGNIKLLEHTIDKSNLLENIIKENCTYYAVKGGNLQMVKYLNEYAWSYNLNCLLESCKRNYYDIFKFLIDENCVIINELNLNDTINVILDSPYCYFNYIYNSGYLSDHLELVYELCVFKGRLDLVKLFRIPYNKPLIFNNEYSIFIWNTFNKKQPINYQDINTLIIDDSRELVDRCISIGYTLNESNVSTIIINDRISFIDLIRVTSEESILAAKNGSIEILKYMYSNGIELDKDLYKIAVKNKQREVIIFLRDINYIKELEIDDYIKPTYKGVSDIVNLIGLIIKNNV